MIELLTASPSVDAYRARPMSATEIDAHPDAARIWATVMSVAKSARDDERADLADRIRDIADDL